MICAPRQEPLELECAWPEVAKPPSTSPWNCNVPALPEVAKPPSASPSSLRKRGSNFVQDAVLLDCPSGRCL